ncbi:MAG: PepSY-associated TM helix domain-containing protein [Opitutaceae bacterium]
MFRKILFWSHLAAGLISGLAIGIMCFTGTALAFEKQLIAWSERDARLIAEPAPSAARLSLEEVQAKLRAAQPDLRPASLVIQNDPQAAIAFPAGRAAGFYVNPYTGEVRQPQSNAMGRFMTTMVAWHRYLGFSGEVSRPRGKWINGVCNLAFCVLAMTGLYLWIPRNWSLRGVKAVAIFNGRLAGKARDFNWHNSIGLWSAPILIVLTLTAVPISFQWGGRVINSLTGTPQPAPGAPPVVPASAVAAVVVPPPPAGTLPLTQDALVARVQKEIPQWETITIGGAGGRGGAVGSRGGRGGRAGPRAEATPGSGNPAPTAVATTPTATALVASAAPATFTVRSRDVWPRNANITLALNPYTGEVLRRTGYADQAAPQRVRAWTRFLHTGEALGFWGQLVAGLACLGGCFLVYTGFALSWRRFFGKKTSPPSTA